MENINVTHPVSPAPGQEMTDKYYEALAAYLAKYNRNGQRPMLPLRASSYVGSKNIYLRKWGYLIAVYNVERKEFLQLTEELIRKYSVNTPPS